MNVQQSNVIRFLLAAALLVAVAPGVAGAMFPPPPPPTPTPVPTPRYELSIASGKASKVAAEPTPGPGESGDSIVKITGSFVYTDPTYLRWRKVTLRSLLDETGGAGELVAELRDDPPVEMNITLGSPRGNDDSAIFRTPGGSRPSARLSLRRKPGGLYLVNLSLNRANIPNDPMLCSGSPPTTQLAAEFVIEDAVQPPPPELPAHPPITVAGTVAWNCVLDLDKLRVPTGSGGEDGGNKAPKASVRVEVLDRDTGSPSRVQLDGSNSSDADGTIVSYAFSVESKPGGVPVFSAPAGAASFVTTPPIPPGDYTAILIVTDDMGAQSAPNTRTFSIK